jgi:trimethylamine---corrinoid protein Co-methyltransferase
MIYGLGMLESGITFDFGQLVVDAEFARMIKHVVEGIPVDDETLALGAIKDIGPCGDFLSHPHTVKRMRAQSRPEYIDRSMRTNWEKKGSKTVYQKALEKARQILETHTPQPLPRAVQNNIRNIVLEAELEMGMNQKAPRGSREKS